MVEVYYVNGLLGLGTVCVFVFCPKTINIEKPIHVVYKIVKILRVDEKLCVWW